MSYSCAFFHPHQEQGKASSQEANFCKPCNKSFSTVNSYENHIRSKKHSDVISGVEKPKRANKQPLNTAAKPAVDEKEVIEDIAEAMAEGLLIL